MTISPRKLGTLTRGEAMSLLAGVALGRVVFTENAMPAIRPASHLVDAGVVIVRSHDGSPVVPAVSGIEWVVGPQRETVVAYQADSIDMDTRLGWSVVVTGPATPVTDPGEIARHAAVLTPWTDAEAGQLIRVHPGIVTGYRLLD